MLLSFPEVTATARRTGRAELDEHAQDVNSAEIDAKLEMKERDKAEFLAELRQALAAIPGMVINVGQPLAHRIDHMLSGTRANIAVGTRSMLRDSPLFGSWWASFSTKRSAASSKGFQRANSTPALRSSSSSRRPGSCPAATKCRYGVGA